MAKKIGIATVYTGFNYGSSLQAYATKKLLLNIGYLPVLLKLKGSFVAGRDVRIKKLLTIVFRSMLHSGGLKSLKNYGNSVLKELSSDSIRMFNDFESKELAPFETSYHELRKISKKDEYSAFVCGSDQIWNSSVFYVDPFYYLRFAPKNKRIAFAPSFGREFVPDYNKRKISKYVSDIKYKSVREKSGVDIIKDLTGADAINLIDPTLVLNANEWTENLNLKETKTEEYIFAYFLDEPSPNAISSIKEISKKYGLKIIGASYSFDSMPWKDAIVSAGPKEFVNYIRNAKFVCTDSFHGTAFSLNFNIPFYTFERNYKNASNQSARIKSILELVEKTERFEPEDISKCMDISFENVNRVLESERAKSKSYLISALSNGEH